MTEATAEQVAETPRPGPGGEVWADLDKELGFEKDPARIDEPTEAAEREIAELLGEEEPGAERPPQEAEPEPGEEIKEEGETDAVQEGEQEGEPEAAAPEVDYQLEVEVPMSHGMDRMTVGQMKDKLQDWHLQDQAREKAVTELAAERRLIDLYRQALGEIPPEARQRAEELNAWTVARESQRLRDAIPEWQDNQRYTADNEAMLEIAKQYGFSEADYAATIDHRAVRMLRRLMTLENMVSRAEKRLKPKPKPSTRPGRRGNSKAEKLNQMVNRAKESKDPALKDAAIAKLLGD